MAKSAELSEHEQGVSHSPLNWRYFYEMTKPKVVMLLLLTALVGMCLATPGLVPAGILVAGLMGIGLLASSAAVINHVVDHKIDSMMARTYNRPVAKGKVGVGQALWFALALGATGFGCLMIWVNELTAWVTLASLVGYAGVYTMFLKRATPQNIVIGGLAGAAPPLLGWTAVTGEIHPHALLLVLIVFTWTPPHFWALAIHRKKEYARADIPMLPVTHGEAFTKTWVLGYTALLMLVGFLPYLTGMSYLIYLVGSTLLNAGFVWYAWQLKFSDAPGWAMKTFRFSIVHLMVLFVVLLIDHYIPITL